MKLLLTFFLIALQVTAAVRIKSTPTLIVDGRYDLIAIKSDSGSTVQWKVNRYLIDESTNEETFTNNFMVAEGDTVNFIFLKIPNKITYYKVFATENNLTDSIRFQIFTKGIRQKYIYNNKSFPYVKINVFIDVPSIFTEDSKFIMVMHGTNRNADDYAETWKNFANVNNYIITAPEFNDNAWGGSRRYNLGNMFLNGPPYNNLLPENRWTFFIVQQIQKEIRKGFGLMDSTYSIWGHSAGAQFVHRMMFFLPDPNIKYAIAANAGWYTLPDLAVEYPWGLNNPELSYMEDDILNYTSQNLIIMRGTADTLRDDNLNTKPLSDEQGENRYERAGYFYNKALAIDPSTKWKLIDVVGAGHDKDQMAPAAQDFLLNVTSVNKRDNIVQKEFKLFQNYPNPFNPTTMIKYQLAKGNHVVLRVYDILGRVVATLINEYQNQGIYNVPFDASSVKGGLSTGIYFYRLSTDNNFVETKKIVLLK